MVWRSVRKNVQERIKMAPRSLIKPPIATIQVLARLRASTKHQWKNPWRKFKSRRSRVLKMNPWKSRNATETPILKTSLSWNFCIRDRKLKFLISLRRILSMFTHWILADLCSRGLMCQTMSTWRSMVVSVTTFGSSKNHSWDTDSLKISRITTHTVRSTLAPLFQ